MCMYVRSQPTSGRDDTPTGSEPGFKRSLMQSNKGKLQFLYK